MPGQTVREIMTPNPVCLPSSATVVEAAEQMRANNIGDVLVVDGMALTGIVTDRDLVVRAIAPGLDPRITNLAEVASPGWVAVGPDDSVDKAVTLMRDNALRRLPVTNERQEVMGVVTLGDLAMDQDPHSALSEISEAPPNK
ncbi:oxidoreductase [Rhizocola hellebori]|uniref:Oxidoreductase n=1 Tax=Rhizocola hellebori TaxID=1392758 RepID=A0A8J3VIM6_9ACTN|nr:CBS domain-containing protein [Rhizocola hellebori]GIH08559.1 oxidoreductase [Rhizocola hellebori]